MTEKITSDTIKSEIKNKKKIQKPSKHDLIQSLIEKNILLEEYQNKMKYMQADFENYRKRIVFALIFCCGGERHFHR